jgi:hypothetical protein
VIITPVTGALALDTGFELVSVLVRALPRAPAAFMVVAGAVLPRPVIWGATSPRGPPAALSLHPASRTRFAACGFSASA